MAKKKKVDRSTHLNQLPGRRHHDEDLISLSKKAGLAALRLAGKSVNIVTAVRLNWNLRGFILLCFFFSGLASLIYQVLWVRQLGLIFGTTLQSVSTVLAIFMAGLALGSYLFGKIADRVSSPIRLFAFLEMGIGVYVMLIPLIFMALNAVQVSIYAVLPVGHVGVTLLRILGCFIVLIVPTTLMGGTLPVIAKFFVRNESELGGGVGNLYFINTLGAVSGAFLAGFFLIPYIGVLASTFLAASIDFAVGVIFYLLHRYKLKPVEEPLPAVEIVREAEEVVPVAVTVPQQLSKKRLKRLQRIERRMKQLNLSGYSRTMKLVVLVGFGFGGLASLSLEVSWTRVLSMVMGSSTYAFSLMLTAFLLGIALGSSIAARFIDRVRQPWVHFFAVQALIGISIVIINPLLGRMPLLFVRIFPGLAANFWALQVVQFLLLLLLMLIPTLLMGAAFPIAARIYADDTEHLGGSVGRLYAGNSFGSMVGPLLTGFVIIPLIGVQWSVSLVAMIYLVIAGAVFVVGFRHRFKVPDLSPLRHFLYGCLRPRKMLKIIRSIAISPLALIWVLLHPLQSTRGVGRVLSRVAVPLSAIVLLLAFIINLLLPVWGTWDKKILNSGVFLYYGSYYQEGASISESIIGQGQLIFYKEGLMSTVAVYNEANGDRALTIDGKADATAFADLSTELMLGHLPMLLHPNPEQVLVIGLGSGITLGAVQLHEQLVSVEAVEIEGAVIEAAAYFAGLNNDALNNDKLTMIHADARNYVLAQTRKAVKYDVITAEPSNPWMAGNSNLFTREQFELYKRALNDDGILCQWLHYYSMSQEDIKTVINTFTRVFPNATLWRTPNDIMLIGTKGEQSIDFTALQSRVQQDTILADMKRVNVRNVYDLLGMFVMGPDALATYSAGSPLHTDNLPILQFSAPKSLYRSDAATENIRRLQARAQKIEEVGSLVVNQEAGFTTRMQRQRELWSYFCQGPINLANNAVDEAEKAFIAMLNTGANDAFAHKVLGQFYISSGDSAKAIDHLEKATALNPTDATVWVSMADIYVGQGQLQKAVEANSNAINLVNDSALLYSKRAHVYQKMENWDAAIED